MADKRIDQLTAATTMGDDDLLVLQQNNQAKKLSGATLSDYIYDVVEVSNTEPVESRNKVWIKPSSEDLELVEKSDLDAAIAEHTEAIDKAISFALEDKVISNAAFASFNDGSDGMSVKKLVVNIEPVQSGSGDPSSTNVRTITGQEVVYLSCTGKNLYEQENRFATYKQSDGTFRGTTNEMRKQSWYTIPSWAVGEKVSYSFYAADGNNDSRFVAACTQVDGDINKRGQDIYGGNTNFVRTVRTIQLTATRTRVNIGFNSSSYFTLKDFQLEIGSSATEYEPFGNRYEIAFPSEVGPVYGAKLDVINGLLSITHGYIAEYAGETLPGKWISSMDLYAENATPTNGAQVVYELAAPISYQIDPIDIKTRSGLNTIWLDGGSISELIYQAKINTAEEIKQVINLIPPKYYTDNLYLTNKINDINSAMEDAAGNFDAFFFLTDAHWTYNAKNSPALIKYISDRIPIPRLIFGGDPGEGINLNFMKAFKDAYSGEIYFVMGNHEYHHRYTDIGKSAETRTMTEAILWNYYNSGLKNIVIGNAMRHYYYFDNPIQKIRYIILNNFAPSGTSVAESFENDQSAWLENTALNLPSGYTALIFAHSIAAVNHTTGVCAPSSTGLTMANIADNYSGDGEIAALICGHRHFDGLGSTTGGIPVFVTTCDKYGVAPTYDDWLANTRWKDTIYEQAFDVFVIDKTNKKITAVRIGCPADNPAGSPLQKRTANYG